MQFKNIPLGYLKSNDYHPEIPSHYIFSAQTYRWRTGKECGVLTHEGVVLGFIVKDLPEGFPRTCLKRDSFAKSKLTLRQINEWCGYDAIECTINTRFAFWFVNPKHQDLLPLPFYRRLRKTHAL